MRDDDDLEAHLVDAGDVPADWVQRMVDRLPADDDDLEAERMAEMARLRDGIGTADELADYDAARRMRLSGE